MFNCLCAQQSNANRTRFICIDRKLSRQMLIEPLAESIIYDEQFFFSPGKKEAKSDGILRDFLCQKETRASGGSRRRCLLKSFLRINRERVRCFSSLFTVEIFQARRKSFPRRKSNDEFFPQWKRKTFFS